LAAGSAESQNWSTCTWKIELSSPGFKPMPVFLQKTFSGRFMVSKDGKRKGILFGGDFFARKPI
jgi:hypothetical protein